MENTANGSIRTGENSAALTIGSREIAELTGKEHKHVMRDIRNMMEALSMSPNLDSYCKPSTYVGKDGRNYDQYELDRDTCMTLLLGYDAVARMKVVKRWQELERANAAPAIRDPQIAAMVLALRELDAVKQEQERLAAEQRAQGARVERLREEVAVIGARTQPESRHFTVMGWARLRGEDMPIEKAAALGRRCANLSRKRGLHIGDVSDPRFGTVHSYHDSVLSEVIGRAPKGKR